jgi:hypothetical protein
MRDRVTPRRRFGVLLLLSLLLHIVGITMLDWPRTRTHEPVPAPAPRTTQVRLRPTPELAPEVVEPTPEELSEVIEPPAEQRADEEIPAPVHNAQDSGSRNQDEQVRGEIVFGERAARDVPDPAPAPSEAAESSPPGAAAGRDAEVVDSPEAPPAPAREVLTTATGKVSWTVPKHALTEAPSPEAASRPEQAAREALKQRVEADLKALFGPDFSPDQATIDALQEIAPPDLQEDAEGALQLGNMALLSDRQLREAGVEQPFSEQESEQLRVVNLILDRMNRQVREHWVNPYQGGQMFRGVIKVELDIDGYLRDVWVHRPSGVVLLDISVLDAIRAVKRFEVPENKVVAERYYTHLSFHYSSIEEQTELLPFEREANAAAHEPAQKTNATQETKP